MLTRNTLSALTPCLRGIWRNPSPRSKLLQITGTRSYYPPPQTSLTSRLLYRADGTPRSKWKGLAIATTISGTVFLFYEAALVVDELDSAVQHLTVLVHVQRVDNSFSTTDFSKFDDTLAYFRELRGLFGLPPELMDEFFDDVRRLLGEDGHRMMRTACERIHDALHDQNAKEEDAILLAAKVVHALDQVTVEMLQKLDELLEDDLVHNRNQRIKEQMLTDGSETEGADYEAVG